MNRIQLCIYVLALAIMAPTAGWAASTAGLVLVESPRPATAATLLDSGVDVIADAGNYLLATAPAEAQAALDRSGCRWRVIDPDISGRTYYIAYASPARFDRAMARAAAAPAGAEIVPLAAFHSSVVIEADERSALTLSGAGVDIARVYFTPMRIAPSRPLAPVVSQWEFDPEVAAMVADVSVDRIDATVSRLQAFETRWAQHDSCGAAADYIRAAFEATAVDTVYDHQWDERFYPNIIAVKRGTAHPERVYIIGGHYDSITNDWDHCPGADDNASGTAGVIESARVLAEHDFEYTIMFIAFCAEEWGLMGAENYAREAAARGDIIFAMINLDMIGYTAAGDDVDLDVVTNIASGWLGDVAMNAASMYVPGFPVTEGALTIGTSDHNAFWRNGFHAVLFFEDTTEYSPFIHTIDDVVGTSYVSPELAENTVKLTVAAAATLARRAVEPPPAPRSAYRVTLMPASPNPFNRSTVIPFDVGPAGASVTLRIYDVAGRLVRTMAVAERFVGVNTVEWDGRDDSGGKLPSGVYMVRLDGLGQTATRKTILAK